MANCLAYERIHVADTAARPQSGVIQTGAACGIFYLDPEAIGPVRWRSDGQDPTATEGFPLYPGGHFVLAGAGNLFKARFIASPGEGGEVHATYFDRVDVLAIQFGPPPARPGPSDSPTIDLTELERLCRQIRNAVGYLAFDEVGDDLPDD